MKIGIAVDHGGYGLKNMIIVAIKNSGHEPVDFGAESFDPDDDYPDIVIPMAQAVSKGDIDRGIAVCGSGVGACVAANKIAGIRAGLISDCYSAKQGVEDDNMNIICLGGRILGEELAGVLVEEFLAAVFRGDDRYQRRLDKISILEENP